MSSMVVDLKAQRDRALAKAEEILTVAERQKRPLSSIENEIIHKCTDQAGQLKGEIDRVEMLKTLRAQTPTVSSLPSSASAANSNDKLFPKSFSREYAEAFYQHFRSGGGSRGGMLAASVEGTDSLGGWAVPLVQEPQVVQLAPSDYAVRNLSTVIPTVCDRRIARVTALPTASTKGEGALFVASDTTYAPTTLSAYIVGTQQDASMELFEDALLFQETVLRDRTAALQEWEEAKFLLGSGSGEPQGLLGNVGAGVTGVTADGSGNLLPISATYDAMGTVKSRYLNNATWLMSRATAVELRKAAVLSGLFEHVFSRENGTDLLHGHPIAYSDGMPSVAPGNTPVLFGDFRTAYIIGDRRGSAVSMKILDQANIVNGIFTLLVYRRVDGRVRCPEAVQGITLHT
jgi:HK97 family phage major capsid protein